MFPSLAPYRDSGEMCTSIHKLGIMHQPGYPLYTIIGKFFITYVMPLSNIAYRINLLSAISTSISSVLIYLILTKYIKLNTVIAFLLTIFWNTFYLLWYLSLVSEMYTLNMLFAISILFLLLKFRSACQAKYLYLLAFVFGIGLGNRLDLLLISPPLLVYIISILYNSQIRLFHKNIIKIFLHSAVFFTIGFVIYLYLPIRSNSNPYLDWGHPANLSQLLSSLLRSRYGGTLDLISVSYRKGENFIDGLLYYFNYIIQHFSIAGIIIILLGIFFLYSIDKFLSIFNLLWFLTTGIAFIYLANMPPNPHAMAILEAHLVLPTLPLFISFFYGIKFLLNIIHSKYFPKILSITLLLIAVFKIIPLWNNINKRQNFILQDYSKNLLKGIPKNSIIVLKEDVQIFSQWYRWYVENKHINIVPVAQGLAGSTWYQNQMKRLLNDKSIQNVYLTQLKDKSGFCEFVLNNKTPIFFATNTDIPPGINNKLKLLPYGLSLLATMDEKKETPPSLDTIDKLIDELYIYRVRYYYNYWYEFFTPDIIEDYARGYHQIGMLFLKNNNYEMAKKYFLSAIALHPYMGLGYEGLGYIFFSLGDYNNAIIWYKRGKNIFEKLYEKAVKYKANEDIKISILEGWANIVNNLGVIYERKNENEMALNLFNEILNKLPNNINALYNKFVVYYKLKEIKSAAEMIKKIYSINPGNQQIKPYLWLLNL